MIRAFGPETDGFTDFLLPRVPGDTTDPQTHDAMTALRALARRAFGARPPQAPTDADSAG